MPVISPEDNRGSLPDSSCKNKVEAKEEPVKPVNKNKRTKQQSSMANQKLQSSKSVKSVTQPVNTETMNQQFELFSPSAPAEKGLSTESEMKVDEIDCRNSVESKKNEENKNVTVQKEQTDNTGNIMSVDSHASSIGILSPASSAGTESVGLESTPSSVFTFGALSPHLSTNLPSRSQNTMRQNPQNLPPQTQRSASPVSVPSLQSVGSSSQPDNISLHGNDSVSRASPNSHCSSITNFSSPSDLPYSAESLFNSPSKPSKLHHLPSVSTSSNDHQTPMEKSPPQTTKAKNNIYSAENFVHSSRSETVESGAKNSSNSSYQPNVLSPSLPNNFNRTTTDSSDSFNFASIGMNLTSVSSTGSFMDNLSSIQSTVASTSIPSTSSSFTFSLSSTTSTSTSSGNNNMSGGAVSHQFPFFPPLHLQSVPTTSANEIPNSQQQQPIMSSFSNDIQKREMNLSNFNNESVSKRESARQMSNHNQNDCVNQRRMPKSQTQNRQNSSPFSFALEGMCASREANLFNEPTHVNSGNMQQVLEKTSHNPMRNAQKRFPEMNTSRQMQSSHNCKNRNISSVEHIPQMNNSSNNVPPYFSQSNFQASQTLNTPPLHHPPLPAEETRNSIPGRTPYDTVFSASNQHFNPAQNFAVSRFEQSPMPFGQRDPGNTQPLTHRPSSSDGRKSVGQTNVSSKHSKQVSQQPSPMNQQQPPQMSAPPPSHSSRPTPPQANPHQPSNMSQSNPSQQHSQAVQPRQSKSSRSSKQQSHKKSNKQYPEVDSNLSHSIFEANRSITPFFPFQNLSPPPRNMQPEGPPFIHSNIFGPGPGPRPSGAMAKNGDISNFNQLFQPSRPQNGLGINFQPGFGMNPVHGNHSNTPQITPHSASLTVTPHVPNFNLSNIFSESASQNEGHNISPIKFHHANTILPPQPGMDPNSLHHPQQGRSLYQHSRNHPPPPVIHNTMSINSILGHNPHGFDGRPMGQSINTSVAPPFHGHGHPPSFALPTLNFSMHDH